MTPTPTKKHAHCWHYLSGWSNGMASAGEDSEICCTCGVRRTRKWTAGYDPAHGSYHPIRTKVYADQKVSR